MKFHIYKDKKGEWRWSAKNVQNGKIIADSAEGFTRKESAFKNAKKFRRDAMVSDIVVDEPSVKKVAVKKTAAKKAVAKKRTPNKGK